MIALRSKLSRDFGHPYFVVYIESFHESEGRSLIEHFENSVKSGKVFKTGETIDIGWGRLKLLANETGDLVVHEPSFFDMPIKWVAGASRSYSHLMLQRQVCLELDVVPDFASLMQAGVISEFMMVNRGDFRMDRHDGDGKGNSGWALYELGKIDAERVQWVSLFQISVMYSQIIPFCALPSGSSVVYQSDVIEVAYADKNINSNSNEFLRQLLSSKNYGKLLG